MFVIDMLCEWLDGCRKDGVLLWLLSKRSPYGFFV